MSARTISAVALGWYLIMTSAQIWTVRVNQPIVLDPVSTLRVLNVTDSRCPINARCIWAGTAQVTLELNTVRGLQCASATTPCNAGTTQHKLALDKKVMLENGDVIQLQTVAPAPGSLPRAITQADYTITLALLGRQRPDSPSLPQPLLYELAWDKWNNDAGAPRDYAYRYQRSCFCTDMYRRPQFVMVEDGRVTHAEFADNNDKEVVPPQMRDGLPTVIDLFQHIRDALHDQHMTVRVTYNDTLGYPTHVFTEPIGTADAEFDVSMTGLTIVQHTSPSSRRQ